MSRHSFLSALIGISLALGGTRSHAADPTAEDTHSDALSDYSMTPLEAAAWTTACLGISTLVVAGVFAVEARQESERIETHSSHQFDNRYEARRDAAIAFAALSGAAFVTTAVLGTLAHRRNRELQANSSSISLSVGPGSAIAEVCF